MRHDTVLDRARDHVRVTATIILFIAFASLYTIIVGSLFLLSLRLI